MRFVSRYRLSVFGVTSSLCLRILGVWFRFVHCSSERGESGTVRGALDVRSPRVVLCNAISQNTSVTSETRRKNDRVIFGFAGSEHREIAQVCSDAGRSGGW